MAQQPDQTYLGFDVSQIISDMSIPGIDVAGIVASQRRNIDALTEANRLAMEGIQAVFRRQAEIIRHSFEESAAVAHTMLNPDNRSEPGVSQTQLASDAFERTLANARELSEIIAKSNNEAFDLLNKRFSQVLDEIKDGTGKINA